MGARAGFDAGPLSWVKHEIDSALQRATGALATYGTALAEGRHDAAALKNAQAFLHQAHGALQIVGLDGVTRVTQEIEALLGDFDKHEERRVAEGVEAAQVAMRAIAAYLNAAVAGKRSPPLTLLAPLDALLAARGAAAADPVDLYFPDLAVRPPARVQPVPARHPDEARQALRELRVRYQRGLLAFLRGDRSGASEMRSTVEAIEAMQSLTAQRAFWWVALAFFDALVHDALPAGATGTLAAKRVCNRIEQQIRALSEGSLNVAERLLREALYHVAHAQPVTEQVREVQSAYQLAATLPEQSPVLSAEEAERRAALEAARSAHARAKDTWDRFATGDAASLAAFGEAAAEMETESVRLGRPAIAALTRAIGEAGRWLIEDPSRANEALSLEQATALLLAGSALTDPEALDAAFDEQSRLVCSRLAECIEGRLLRTAIDIPLLDEMSRRAQEDLIAEQALVDLRTHLRAVEQRLDRFFRNPSTRQVLGEVAEPLEQLDRAFALLGETRAQGALAEAATEIRRFSASDFAAAGPEFTAACERVANTLSGLGFYIEALARGEADFDAAMRPVRTERDAQPAPSVEDKLAAEKREIQRLAEAIGRAPQDAALKQALQQNLAAVQEDAALVADDRLQAAAASALESLASDASHITEALGELAPGVATPSLSAAAERVVEAQAAGALEAAVDAELLDVYLEEAGEVLAAVSSGAEALRDGTDADALVAIRRGFHTLKGSGRMVGLTRLGEVAWAVEQALNLWLQEARPVDDNLLAFIAAAHAYFTASIAALRAGRGIPDETALVALGESLRRGEAIARVQAREPEPQISLPEGLVPDAGAPADEVEIGGNRVSTTLFTIFSGEAHMHLNRLKEEHETLKVHGVITDEMILSAHTLAGIAGTVQLTALHELAKALEAALSALGVEPLSEEEDGLVASAIDALDAMVSDAVALRAPAAAPELVERLRALAVADGASGLDVPPMIPEDEGALHVPLPAPAANEPAEPGAVEPVESGRRARAEDQVDPHLVPVFLEEAAELVPALEAVLREWRAAPDAAAPAQSAKRLLHTLKGSARMAGAMALGELTHYMEARIEALGGTGRAPAQLFEELETSMDRMATLLERLRGAPAGHASPAPEAVAAPPASETLALLRVRADLVDRLVNQAGEVAIARSRIETEIRSLRSTVVELTDNVARLRRQLREIEIQAESQMQSQRELADATRQEFDPLELDRFTRFQEVTRMMAESVNDVHTVQQNLVHAVDATDAALAAQARLNRDLQHDLMRVRMVPVGSLAERLHRVVRQAARELGKQAELDLRGAEVELDRSVLERMTAPLEHMVRNAVAHGIEMPEAREAAGKPAVGTIHLNVSQEGNEVVLVLADDGAGLDPELVLARARDLQLPGADGEPSAAEIADFLFMPGFSTAPEVSEISGRGVGMDVVRSEVARLGGRIELTSERGRGMRLAVYLPLTLAVTQAVMVRVGARTFAVPAVMVEHVMQLRGDEIARLREEGASASLEWQSRHYAFGELAALLGLPVSEAQPGPVLLVRSGSNAVCVRVDEILSSSQELVVKAIGPHVARIPGIGGASVLGSGEIVLILNPAQLAVSRPQSEVEPPVEVEVPPPPLVMVVDDSLTVRKITGRLLERQGYRVAVARDGVEALEQLAERTPALPSVMLVDIEMPRMDGFELTRNIRSDARFASIPIIMITSRAAEKHQQHAREIGVDCYLGKPFQEEQLLGHIAQLATQGRATVAGT